MLNDLRYALRTLRKQPGFTLAAVLTLALGIGATTTIFSAVDAALLRPLPFPDPDRLYQLDLTVPNTANSQGDSLPWSYPKFMTLREAASGFEQVAAYGTVEASLTGSGDPEWVRVELVSASYFDLLGVPTASGRGLRPDEDAPSGAPVAILSHGLWLRRFGADAGVLGQVIEVNRQPHTVVGVAPPWFRGLTRQADVFTTLASAPGVYYAESLDERWNHWLLVAGRLAPDLTADDARREMAQIGRIVDEAHPRPSAAESERWSATAQPRASAVTDPVLRRALLVLLGAVGLVLLLACVNVAGLMLVRVSAGEREIGVRVALGAQRWRVARQLVVESLILAAGGGVLGLLLAAWGTDLLRTLQPSVIGPPC